jgi:CRP-like cAMP-binding protein
MEGGGPSAMAENMLFNKYGHVVDSGKIIFREGEEGDNMYIIQEGTVRISKKIGGKEHTLAVLGKGDFFGEMAIVNRVRRSATATAGETVKYLVFDRQGFISMIEKNAKIALNVIDKLCKRLQQANLQIQYLKRQDEKGLVALNLYYDFAEAGSTSANLDKVKTTRDIALNLEVSPDVVAGYLREFEQERIIKTDDKNITLLDGKQLQAVAGQ